ncbi:MAG: hypothetical protein KDC58_04220 [Cyclobacteriaceae bacterium]|nr:hypothetical protein [Cyclobacteriaceae bacterium]
MILNQALSYKTKRYQKDNNGLRSSIPYNEAVHIGIVFSNDAPDKSVMAEQLAAHYRADNKQTKVVAYDRNVQVKHLPFESFSNKDISFWGSFVNQSINHFSEISFDFLICLDNPPGKIIQNLIAKSKAKCRVGIGFGNGINGELFELVIQTANDANLVDSIYTYTKNIR